MKNFLILVFVLIAGIASAQIDSTAADGVIDGVDDKEMISVFPNPVLTSHQLNVVGDYDAVTLVDMQGRSLLDVAKNQPIALASINPGLYVVRVFTANRWHSTRVLIE